MSEVRTPRQQTQHDRKLKRERIGYRNRATGAREEPGGNRRRVKVGPVDVEEVSLHELVIVEEIIDIDLRPPPHAPAPEVQVFGVIPVIWRDNRLPKGKEDNYFQRRLHLGLFTMCPYPENDHGVRWEPAEGRQPWVDYGLMMAALKGKKWVLEPHCIQVSGDEAQANLFEVEGGWAAPITLGKSDKVKVQIRNVPFLSGKIKVEVLHPGVKQPLLVQSRIKNEVAEIVVPLIRGCAMIRISKK